MAQPAELDMPGLGHRQVAVQAKRGVHKLEPVDSPAISQNVSQDSSLIMDFRQDMTSTPQTSIER